MQINRILADPTGAAVGLAVLPPASAAAAAVLQDRSTGLDQQLKAYHDLAGQWRGARAHGQRAALAYALTDSPFGQRVNDALNSFTRAAWAGAEAVPPEPQAKALEAFDSLAKDDQQIVATLHADPSTGVAFVSATDYRASLQADVEAAGSGAARKPDTVTLSAEAQARLAGGSSPPPEEPSVEAANPLLARVLAAYAKAAG